MSPKKRVIVLTDGDLSALRAARLVCPELGVGLIEISAGSPSASGIVAIEDAIVASPFPTVLVLADDAGRPGEGEGEALIDMLSTSPVAEIVAAVAVASRTYDDAAVKVGESVTDACRVVPVAVDKRGRPMSRRRLRGDTVGALRRLGVPVVGIGDPGLGKGHSGRQGLRRALAEAMRLAEEQLPIG